MVDYGYCLSRILTLLSWIVTLRFITCVVDQPDHYCAQDSSKRCNECRWETWTKWKPFMRKRNEAFRYTPSKETTTIWVKQAALRLVDRLARDVPQPARKEALKGTLKMVSSGAVYALSSFSSKAPVAYAIQFEWLTWSLSPFFTLDKIKAQTQPDANRFRPWMGW